MPPGATGTPGPGSPQAPPRHAGWSARRPIGLSTQACVFRWTRGVSLRARIFWRAEVFKVLQFLTKQNLGEINRGQSPISGTFATAMGNRALTPIFFLAARELHRPGGAAVRMAEGDPAVGREREPFAVQQDFVLALDGDVGAVGAVVQQEELVVARFQGAVLPRRQLVGDHQVAGLGPADHDARMVLP